MLNLVKILPELTVYDRSGLNPGYRFDGYRSLVICVCSPSFANTPHSKCGLPSGNGGSNPSLSAGRQTLFLKRNGVFTLGELICIDLPELTVFDRFRLDSGYRFAGYRSDQPCQSIALMITIIIHPTTQQLLSGM